MVDIIDTRIPYINLEESHVELISLKEIRIFSHEDFLLGALHEEYEPIYNGLRYSFGEEYLADYKEKLLQLFKQDIAASLKDCDTNKSFAFAYKKHCRAVRIPIGDRRYYMAYKGPGCLFTFSEKIKYRRDPPSFFSM